MRKPRSITPGQNQQAFPFEELDRLEEQQRHQLEDFLRLLDPTDAEALTGTIQMYLREGRIADLFTYTQQYNQLKNLTPMKLLAYASSLKFTTEDRERNMWEQKKLTHPRRDSGDNLHTRLWTYGGKLHQEYITDERRPYFLYLLLRMFHGKMAPSQVQDVQDRIALEQRARYQQVREVLVSNAAQPKRRAAK